MEEEAVAVTIVPTPRPSPPSLAASLPPCPCRSRSKADWVRPDSLTPRDSRHCPRTTVIMATAVTVTATVTVDTVAAVQDIVATVASRALRWGEWEGRARACLRSPIWPVPCLCNNPSRTATRVRRLYLRLLRLVSALTRLRTTCLSRVFRLPVHRWWGQGCCLVALLRCWIRRCSLIVRVVCRCRCSWRSCRRNCGSNRRNWQRSSST